MAIGWSRRGLVIGGIIAMAATRTDASLVGGFGKSLEQTTNVDTIGPR